MKPIIVFLFCAVLVISACGSGNEKTSTSGDVQQVDNTGKRLFLSNCMMCHSLNADRTGPKLAGVLQRWNNDTAKVVAFIKNSQEVIKSGDAYANQLYNQWHQAGMQSFTQLTDEQIKAVVLYINAGVE